MKDFYLARVRSHKEANELLQNYGYWRGGRGCAVGCTINGSDHFAYERDLGIPVSLAFLEDKIFESLPFAKAKEWPELFLSPIRPGADLSKVWPQFAAWLLDDSTDGVIRFANTDETRDLICDVAQLLRDGCTDVHKWRGVENEIYSIRRGDHWSSGEVKMNFSASAALYAAYALAREDVYVAGAKYAVRVALDAAANAEWHAHAVNTANADTPDEIFTDAYIRHSEKLLELLAAAPVSS